MLVAHMASFSDLDLFAESILSLLLAGKVTCCVGFLAANCAVSCGLQS